MNKSKRIFRLILLLLVVTFASVLLVKAVTEEKLKPEISTLIAAKKSEGTAKSFFAIFKEVDPEQGAQILDTAFNIKTWVFTANESYVAQYQEAFRAWSQSTATAAKAEQDKKINAGLSFFAVQLPKSKLLLQQQTLLSNALELCERPRFKPSVAVLKLYEPLSADAIVKAGFDGEMVATHEALGLNSYLRDSWVHSVEYQILTKFFLQPNKTSNWIYDMYYKDLLANPGCTESSCLPTYKKIHEPGLQRASNFVGIWMIDLFTMNVPAVVGKVKVKFESLKSCLFKEH